MIYVVGGFLCAVLWRALIEAALFWYALGSRQRYTVYRGWRGELAVFSAGLAAAIGTVTALMFAGVIG